MKYKFSEYNYYCEKNEVFLIFNTRTLSLVEIEKEKYEMFKNKDLAVINSLDGNDIKDLSYMGFICDRDFDEIKSLKDSYWYNKYCDDTLHITILTTINCNFGCPYCFETRRDVKLTEKIKNAILIFVEEKLENKKQLHVDWYGGEPLVNKEAIYDMSPKLIEICRKKGVIYSGTITTNGYLFDEETVKKLSQLGVQGAQITIDGPKEIHDKMRTLLNGNPTYDIIMKNIKTASKYMKIYIRSNVNEETMEHVDRFIKELVGYKNIQLSIKGIVPASYKDYDKKIMSARDFSSEVIKKYVLAHHYEIPTALDNVLQDNFHRFCIVDSDSQYIFSPEGKILKCGESFTEDDKGIIGSYNEKTKKLEIDEEKKIMWDKDPFDIEECMNCLVLPLCMGGCQMKRNVKKQEACSPELKYNLDELVFDLYERMG